MEQISANIYRVASSDELSDAYWAWVDKEHDGNPPTQPINLTKHQDITTKITVEFKRARTGRYTSQDSVILH